MKPFFLAILIMLSPNLLQAQSIVGKWKTIDDHSKATRSIIEIKASENIFTGTITQLFPAPGEDKDPVCDKVSSTDRRYMKKILGMEIISGLKSDGKEYSGGEILDPEEGKIYRLKVWLEGKDLKVRGYLGPFYRTQTWFRVE